MTHQNTALNPLNIRGTDYNQQTPDARSSHEHALLPRFGLSGYRRRVSLLLLSALMLCASHDPAAAQRPLPAHNDHASKPALPANVQAFKIRRDRCDHLRGEMSGDDGAGAASLQRELQKNCRGTDAELAALRHRYAGNKTIRAALANYENNIE